jgi:sulfatase maturation enzyme AslB (radical SAM superfamily)
MCTQSRIDYAKKGFMELKVWKKLIDDFEKQKVKHKKFLPFGLGESLFHPKAYEMFEYLLNKNKERALFEYIELHTNALMFDRPLADLFLKYQYQFGAISFSLDAATEGTYEKVRPGIV